MKMRGTGVGLEFLRDTMAKGGLVDKRHIVIFWSKCGTSSLLWWVQYKHW